MINDDTLPDPPTLVDFPTSASVDVRYAVSGWGAASSVGMKREVNEDRFGRQSDVFAVADGMGGHSGGVEASECSHRGGVEACCGPRHRCTTWGVESPCSDSQHQSAHQDAEPRLRRRQAAH